MIDMWPKLAPPHQSQSVLLRLVTILERLVFASVEQGLF